MYRPHSHTPRRRRTLTAALATLAIATGSLLAVGIAAPAEAHTSKVAGTAVCEADGTYTVEWTYNATNVPAGVEAETKAMTTTPGTLAPIDGINKGGQIFLSVWTEHQINVPGAPVRTGNWSAKFKTTGIPGTYAGNVTTMVQTDWLRGPSEDPIGTVRVDGSCTAPTPPRETPVPVPVVFTDFTCDTDASIDVTEVDEVAYIFSIDGSAPAHLGDMTIPRAAAGNIVGKHIVVTAEDTVTDETLATYEFTFTAPGSCEVPPAAANPAATVTAVCGAATVILTNPLIADANQLAASFVINIDGAFHSAAAVEAGGREELTLTFDEDSGDHLVEVFQAGTSEWKLIASATASSDCTVVTPPTEEPEPTNPEPTEEPTPGGETPAPAPAPSTTPAPVTAATAPTARANTLAQTGGDMNPALPIAAVLAALVGIALLSPRARRS